MTKTLFGILGTTLLATAAQAQTTWYVDLNGTPPGSGSQADPYTSIQFAIGQAGTLSGDTVWVAPGTYVENLDYLGKDLIVQSSGGAAVTIVDGGGAGSVVTFSSNETAAAVLDGFTLQNGQGSFRDGSTRGGGIDCTGGSPTLQNLVIRGNTATKGGGLHLVSSTATITDSVIEDNRIQGCFFSGTEGTGIYADCSSSPVVLRCQILRNGADDTGGGAFGGGTYGAGNYTECLIQGNRSANGAGVAGGGCNPSFVDCVIDSNSVFNCDALGFGGGVYGPAVLTRCEVSNNSSFLRGGGAYNATLLDSTLRDNRTLSRGPFSATGAGANDCELTNCDVYGNEADSAGVITGSEGGGVWGGTATDCRIYQNHSISEGTLNSSSGGGAYGATLLRCEVFENVVSDPTVTNPTASARGGGAFDCVAERCAFYGNVADDGGGVAEGSLDHCVVTRNTASNTDGGFFAAGSVLNSVVWDNQPSGNTAAGSVTYSLVQGGFAGIGNFTAPPRFIGPEANDYHIKFDSPCIDAGDPSSPLDPDSSIADVGIFPFDAGYCPSAQPYCVAKVNSQGCTPEIGSTGTPSLTGLDDFVITAANIRNDKIGYLFYGSVADAIPFMGGTLCVRPPLRRFGVQLSGGSPGSQQDCTGSYSFHFSQARLQSAGLFAPQTIHLQILYRDPPIGDGTGAGLTDALEATICP